MIMSRLLCIFMSILVVEAGRNLLDQITITIEKNTNSNHQSSVNMGKETKLEPSINLPPNVTVPAVIVFGDSIVDSGNNNNLPTLLKCDFPPYGKDFPGGIPTGRFSDGRVPSDLIAEKLGVRRAIPAYLSPNLKSEELLKGVNFASGGSGYDPLTAKLVSVISIWDQLKYFKEYISKIKEMVGEERAEFILENSIYLVACSSNDIAHTYPARLLKYNRTSYADHLADLALKFVKELHGLGARRVGVLGAVPVGCVPAGRTLFGRRKRKCAEKFNKMALRFNSRLSLSLHSLNQQLPRGNIVYINVYDILLDMIHNPKNYGFEVSDRGCCGTGLVEVVILCNKLNPFTCSNSSAYLFWDSYHPTERAYQIIVDKLLDKHINNFFL